MSNLAVPQTLHFSFREKKIAKNCLRVAKNNCQPSNFWFKIVGRNKIVCRKKLLGNQQHFEVIFLSAVTFALNGRNITEDTADLLIKVACFVKR